MNCDDCRDLILDLLYEELPPATRREAEAHLASCPDCRRELTELKSTVAAVRRLPDPEPPPFLDTKVKARAREAGEATRPRSIWSRLTRPAIAGAALIVIIASVSMIVFETSFKQKALAPFPAEAEKSDQVALARAPESAPLAALGYVDKDGTRLTAPPREAEEAEGLSVGMKGIEGETASLPPVAGMTATPAGGTITSLASAATTIAGGATVSGQTLDELALAKLPKKEKEAAPELTTEKAGPEAGAASAGAANENNWFTPPAPKPQPAPAPPASAPALSEAAPASPPKDLAADHAASRSAKTVSMAGAPMEEKQKAPAKSEGPDVKAMIKQAQELEAQTNFRQALELYEQALAVMGYNKNGAQKARRATEESLEKKSSAPAEPAGNAPVLKKRACSPELRAAGDGALRMYRRLFKLNDRKDLEQWLNSNCP